jgi:hypothetical protein
MERDVQKFLDAEETAEQLVQTLKQLYTEVTSYQTATKELEVVRQRLVGLIESTEKLANGSHEVVGILMKIGGPEILNRLEDLQNKSSEKFAKQTERLNKLKILIMVTLTSSIIAIIIGLIGLFR